MRKTLASPTNRLIAGLAVTLAAVILFSSYALRQMNGLRNLQSELIDRNRRDSLQLLRIQNDLNSLGLDMRDLITGDDPYGLIAWKDHFERTRRDMDDALRIEGDLAPENRRTQRQAYFFRALRQFWFSVDQMFLLAVNGHEKQARLLIRTSLAEQQSGLVTSVARLLVENQEMQDRAAQQVRVIYGRVVRHIYFLLSVVLATISITSLYLIHSNRQLFDRLHELSTQRSRLSRKLISLQEEMFRSLARELHDEFGQILTAIGAMLSRIRKKLPPEMVQDLEEVREIAQHTVDKTRSLSQMLHPPILDDGGIEQAIDWYVSIFQKNTGIPVELEKHGHCGDVAENKAIHIYRVLQESLNNVAKHSRSATARVAVDFTPGQMQLEIQDRGVGLPRDNGGGPRTGIGLIAMRERAELLAGRIEFLRPPDGGTLIRLCVPLTEADSV